MCSACGIFVRPFHGKWIKGQGQERKGSKKWKWKGKRNREEVLNSELGRGSGGGQKKEVNLILLRPLSWFRFTDELFAYSKNIFSDILIDVFYLYKNHLEKN